MTFGVTSEGFNPKRYTDIEQEIFNWWSQELGIEINTQTGSILDQIAQPFIDQIEQVWAALQDLSLSWSPFDASDMSLDYIVAYTGIIRKEPASTIGPFLIDGDDTTSVTTDFRVLSSNNVQYRPVSNFTITLNNIFYANFQIDKLTAINTFYEIKINGTLASFEDTSGSASKSDIVTNLVTIINDDQSIYQAKAYPHADDSEILVVETLQILLNSVEATTNTTYLFRFDFKSVETGPFLLPSKSISSIQTPLTGIRSIQNYKAGITGNNIETDAELFARWQESFIRSGGVLAAIVAAVQSDVDDVTSADGLENVTDFTDSNGLTPHSILIIVQGGDDQEIAQKIWDVKGGGIKTVGIDAGDPSGAIVKTVIDFKGREQECAFYRPIIKYIHLRIRLTLNPDETFVQGTENAIKADCVDHAIQIQGIGDDVISQKYTEKVFNYTGIRLADIKVDLTDTESGPHSSWHDWKEINGLEIAYLSSTNCTVEVI